MVIQLVVLFIIVGFVLFEFFQFKKKHSNDSHVAIPQIANEKKSHNVNPLALLALPVIAIVGVGGILVSGLLGGGTPTNTPQANVVVEEVVSHGIKIYDNKWQELKGTIAAELAPGDTVYCALETIPSADIDRARIRVNATVWQLTDITQQFNKNLNVYYRECKVATSESKLKIEAQLHSVKDGWLGE